jgi:hypothetical protein
VDFEDGVLTVVKPEAFTNAGVSSEQMLTSFARDIAQVQGILRADLLSTLAKADTVHDTMARRWLHMFSPTGPMRVVITLTPYSYWYATNYATHASPHDSDANVPILFWGAGIKPGMHPEVVRVVDMAPTLAALLKVTPLEKLDGVVLRQVIR